MKTLEQRIDYLVSKGYEVSGCKRHVTKKELPQLNCSVNYAYNVLEKQIQ